MPSKLNPETPKEQAERFRREARKLVKSGELDPDSGEAAMDALLQRESANPQKPRASQSGSS